MEEKGKIKISLAGFFLILAIIVIIIMGFIIYKLYNEKNSESEKVSILNSQISNLENTVSNLQGKLNSISNTINSIDETQKPTNKTAKNQEVTVQIIRIYNFEDKEEIVEEVKKNQGDIINLSQNEEYKQYGKRANDIKILEINNDYVKISRDRTMYYDEKIDEYHYSSYTENIVEDIEYNKMIDICIDGLAPDSPETSAARYGYMLKFID